MKQATGVLKWCQKLLTIRFKIIARPYSIHFLKHVVEIEESVLLPKIELEFSWMNVCCLLRKACTVYCHRRLYRHCDHCLYSVFLHSLWICNSESTISFRPLFGFIFTFLSYNDNNIAQTLLVIGNRKEEGSHLDWSHFIDKKNARRPARIDWRHLNRKKPRFEPRAPPGFEPGPLGQNAVALPLAPPPRPKALDTSNC